MTAAPPRDCEEALDPCGPASSPTASPRLAQGVLHRQPMPSHGLEVRIQCRGWRAKLFPDDAIEVWDGATLLATLPGTWLYDAVQQALTLAHLALPLLAALRPPLQKAPGRRAAPAARSHTP